MIDTIHLLPPDLGPRSNPVLFGIAEAIAELLPLKVLASLPAEADSDDAGKEPVPGAEGLRNGDRHSRSNA